MSRDIRVTVTPPTVDRGQGTTTGTAFPVERTTLLVLKLRRNYQQRRSQPCGPECVVGVRDAERNR